MKIIVPMAGMGTRMRPHTLITPKPLLLIAGKAIVERIIEDLKKNTGTSIDEIHYVTGRFGKEVESKLLRIADQIGAKGFIHYQDEALGTAHAVWCAETALNGEVIVAFADTMFVGNMSIEEDDAVIWTLKVDNPEQYGVVLTDSNDVIIDFIEKPKEKISDKAIIGIYYFRKAEILRDSINGLIHNKQTVKGEYQLTDALKNMLNNGYRFRAENVDEWLDCGNKKVFLESTASILDREGMKIPVEYGNTINPPVYIGKNVKIISSEIGPYVAVEDNSEISNSKVSYSNIGMNSKVRQSNISDSLIGNYTNILKADGMLNVGDYNEYEGK